MPNRLISEKICDSERLNQLKDFEERFLIRLSVFCDDYGRMDARPQILKGRLFPLMDGRTQRNMTDALKKLASLDLVGLYEDGGRPYVYMKDWDKVQQIRAKRSKYPTPAGICDQMQADAPVIQSESESKSESESNAGHAARKKYGAYGWIQLSDEEYNGLLEELGEAELKRCITYVDESAQSSGNKNHWKDWRLVLQRCSRNGWGISQTKASFAAKQAAEPANNVDPMAMRAIQRMMEEETPCADID